MTSDRTVPSEGWRRAHQVSERSAACVSLWRQPIPSAMTRMRWPMFGNANGASECANSNVLVASDGTGGSRDTPKSLRKVAFGAATFALDALSGSSFEAQRIGFLGGQVPGRQTVPGAELWSATQALGRVDEKTNSQFTIDATYVTKGATHRGRFFLD